mgnify:FL=1
MLKDQRYIILTLTIALAGCASKATDPLEAQEDKKTAQPTSWHCEQDVDTWSCKRRTIADIQAREAARRSKRFDWSLPPGQQSPLQDGLPNEELEREPTSQPEKQAERQVTNQIDKQPRQATGQPLAPSPSRVADKTEPVRAPRVDSQSRSLEDLPGSYWAVQLIALNSQQELREFMHSTQLDELSGAMIKVKNRTWYVALLGVYENRESAERAAAERPSVLQRYEPYIRSVASLQAAMSAANTL